MAFSRRRGWTRDCQRRLDDVRRPLAPFSPAVLLQRERERERIILKKFITGDDNEMGSSRALRRCCHYSVAVLIITAFPLLTCQAPHWAVMSRSHGSPVAVTCDCMACSLQVRNFALRLMNDSTAVFPLWFRGVTCLSSAALRTSNRDSARAVGLRHAMSYCLCLYCRRRRGVARVLSTWRLRGCAVQESERQAEAARRWRCKMGVLNSARAAFITGCMQKSGKRLIEPATEGARARY